MEKNEIKILINQREILVQINGFKFFTQTLMKSNKLNLNDKAYTLLYINLILSKFGLRK
jgi:hypothetical protein